MNCTAIPENLLEAELFGHEKGAFTGAERRRIGRFEQADRGTVLLDEIGDMSMGTQAKLLRVLQERVIQRVGAEEEIPVDVRVIAATHRDLEKAIQEHRFREDLFYRLNVAVINLPPLRDRKDDTVDLVKFFIQRHAIELDLAAPSITPDALDYLKAQRWPGNVRELENAVCKALLVARGHPITPEILKAVLGKNETPVPPPTKSVGEYIKDLLDRAYDGKIENVEAAVTWDIERELYAQAIERAGGNQAKAARWLGVSRPTMREKLKAYGLHAAATEGGGS